MTRLSKRGKMFDDLIIAMKKHELSSSEIANALRVNYGDDITRDVIIGRARRLGLAKPKQCAP